MKVFLLFLIISQVHAAENFEPSDLIAYNYDAGPYLIYDCVEKHWTCVAESFYKECETKRTREVASSDHRIHHTCAPIGEFPTKRSCFDRQLFMVSQAFGTRFCVRDVWKTKVIKD